ncbi:MULTISPECIES: putative quinol monooxygenase [unclassified Pseudomonas]|jgi:quinol monooxygenase YgiN|uniref:putative quinol monooxygenase n=1 Tax=unclassified Pseudomonas TaxID=196821 RepID=UPI0014321439|nr:MULTISPECIES: putative quinol monooxygenase [unclassified Pseudomonas]MDY0834356.1 putative quinol monooxygenase [Pseudomonas sp. SED1]NIL16582.1 antibiotic biosynthesis monooxygenase [Pseudomonas sp. AN3A02]
MSDEVRLVVIINTQPGRGADQLAAFAGLAPLVRAEAGCIQYDLHPVDGNSDSFVLIETWASKAALKDHHAAPHMLEAAKHNPTFRAGPANVLVLEPAVQTP